MSDLEARVFTLGLQGRCCAQVLVTLALEDAGVEDQLMADAAGALCFGLAEELLCGALAGGALALAVLAGGTVNAVVVSDLVDWFREAVRHHPVRRHPVAATPPRASPAARVS